MSTCVCVMWCWCLTQHLRTYRASEVTVQFVLVFFNHPPVTGFAHN